MITHLRGKSFLQIKYGHIVRIMPKIYLKQPGFTYSACLPLTNNKEKNQKLVQTGNTNYIYKNDLDKACFQHDKAYGKYKDLTKRTASDNVLRDKVFKLLVIQNLMKITED